MTEAQPASKNTFDIGPKDEIEAFANRVFIDDKTDISLLRDSLRVPDLIQREKDYRRFIGVSNSEMGLLADHPQNFLKEKILGIEEEEEKSYYLLGDMIECSLLFPAYFEDLFIQEPDGMKSPSSPNQKALCQHIIDGDTPEEAFRKEYSTKRKSDEKIAEKAQEKYESLKTFIEHQKAVTKSGKRPYSADDMMTVNQAAMRARLHDDISSLLNPTDGELHVQRPLVGVSSVMSKDVLVKGLADWIIETEDKIVNIDLKTTSKPLSDFQYYYHKYRYYRQQGLYAMLLQQEHDKPVETKCVVTRTREPYGARVMDIPESLLWTGVKEARSLLERMVFHITEGHHFTGFLEDEMPGSITMKPMDDLLDRHLKEASLTHHVGQSN